MKPPGSRLTAPVRPVTPRAVRPFDPHPVRDVGRTEPIGLGVLVVATLLCASCDGYVGARGRVYASDGSPVAGATVELDGPQYPKRWRTQSRTDGCFQLGSTTAPTGAAFPMTITKEGFQQITANVRGGDSGLEFDIRLATPTDDSPGSVRKGAPNSVGCSWRGMSSGTDAFSQSKGTQ
jgi:hypothetical protein